MSTKDWGPCTWKTIHHFTMAYPWDPTPHDKQAMMTFLNSICYNLPCKECKMHCSQYMSKHPPNLTSSCELQKWAFNFHNNINVRLGKPQFTVAQYQRKYGTAVKIHRENRLKGK